MAENQEVAGQDPYKTMLIIKAAGKEVGRIPATATNAEAYIRELIDFYGQVSIEYAYDEHAGLLAALHNPR